MDASLNHERKPDELVFEARQALSRLLSFSRTWASELIAGILLAVMIQEGVSWFAFKGTRPVRLTMRIE